MRAKILALFFCSFFGLTALACGSNGGDANDEGDAGYEQDATTPDAGTDPEPEDKPDAGDDPVPPAPNELAHLSACYVPAEWGSDAFDEGSDYAVEAGVEGGEASYAFLAADSFENDSYRQELWIELYPSSATAALTGSFDLADEDFTYATCEHCVLIAAGVSASEMKYFLAESGTLELTEVTSSKISGALIDVTLVEVTIADEATLATERVEDGCVTHIARFDFGHAPPELPEHVAACFVPESIDSQAFDDFIYELIADESREEFFYLAMDVPTPGSGMPSMTLYVEVWQAGLGTFDLATSNNHNVLIETVMPDGRGKGYVATSGELVLTALSETLMEGELRNVGFSAAEITEDSFSLIDGDACVTQLPSLFFSSADATDLDE